MREEVIFRMESAYREDFEVKSYHFGGPEKTMCIIGNMRGNEIQQLYIAGQMVRTLKRFEEEGRFIRRHGVTVIPSQIRILSTLANAFGRWTTPISIECTLAITKVRPLSE